MFVDLMGHRPANIHANDVRDVLDVIQISAGDMVFFYHEVGPVPAAAPENNPRESTCRQRFAICLQHRNIRLSLHHRDLMILRPSRFGRTRAGSVKIAGGERP